MEIPYQFYPRLILRTPQRPITHLLDDKIEIELIVKDEVFLEALFLASPVLFAEVMKYKQGILSEKELNKLKFSLLKYYTRMCSRCTPFGLFSGCSVASWADASEKITLSKTTAQRHTRLDMHYLCALSVYLSKIPEVRSRVLFFTNTSFYQIAEEIRYIEYDYKTGKRKYQISSIESSQILLALLDLAKNGCTMNDLITKVTAAGYDTEVAQGFIDDLIDSQLIISDLEPSVTGEEFLFQIIATLNKLNKPQNELISGIIRFLSQIDVQLKKLDESTSGKLEIYKSITATIKAFNVPFEESKLFQTDTFFKISSGNLDLKLQDQLLEGFTAISKLQRHQERTDLVSFMKRFQERYEDREMPLLEVLDTEAGIGYPENRARHVMPLVDNVITKQFKPDEVQIPWNKKDAFLLHKLLDAYKTNASTVEISDQELSSFPEDWSDFAPSMALTFRLAEEGMLYLDSAGGSSAANLLARFAHGDSDIDDVVNDIVAEEDKQNPDIIFAEVVHLPESRIGNVLLHPCFRKYEIPFLSKSTKPGEFKILLQDIYVSIRDQKIVLRSKALNRQIIPRLTSAHNWAGPNALPVYQFLGDLQTHGNRAGISFQWGALESQFKFLPRVVYKKTILRASQWNFTNEDIKSLLQIDPVHLMEAVAEFKRKWKLSNTILLADSDNELFVKLDSLELVEMWLDVVRSRKMFIVKEFLGVGNNAPVHHGSQASYANQFVAILLKNCPTYIQKKLHIHFPHSTPSSFPLGSEWLYFKIYCGIKTADKVLLEAVRPFVNQTLDSGKIDSFFFVRYNDPHFHLRVRFHLKDVHHLKDLICSFQNCLEPFMKNGLIWKVDTDTYKRELVRYGENTIGIAEQFFFYDSLAVFDFLNHTEGDKRESIRWIWALKAIDELLDAFDFKLIDKMEIVRIIKDSFHVEFNSDKFLKEQLNNKYRQHRRTIEDLLSDEKNQEEDWRQLTNILKIKSIRLKPLLMSLTQSVHTLNVGVPLAQLIPSYIHMLVNRVISVNPRVHELVMYDMLFTYYKSMSKRGGVEVLSTKSKNQESVIA